MPQHSSQTGASPVSGELNRLLSKPRLRYLLLQSLVSIILAYELLFGSDFIISQGTSQGLVVGLWLVIACLAVLPQAVLEAAWFSAGLVVMDTLLVTATIFLSGNARSDLYIAYFVLMLVAASVRRLSYLMGLSLLLSLGYAAVVCEGIFQTGTMAVGQLLGIPVLLVMAVFYGVALENTAVAEEEASTLLKDVEALKKAEDELQVEKPQLEMRVKEMRDDLTKTKANLRERQAVWQGLERQLQESHKMEAVGRVASRIAGEFGALFSVVGKETGVMLSRLQPDDTLRVSANALFKAGEKAATLTAQLAALNLDNRHIQQVLSIQGVLSELQRTIESLLPHSIQLLLLVDQPIAYAEVDREGLENVLLQLAVNARDAMPGGGRLSMEVLTGGAVFQSAGSSALCKRNPQVVIQVSDTGTGMNLDTQARMFEPFFSTKETSIGLGLTAVYGIVKQNGDSVEVESRPGQGAVVRLLFPAAPVPEGGDVRTPKTMMAKGGETILLVEEDEIERKLAMSALQRHKYEVLEAASSVEALMLTRQFKGILHLAVSPLIMPEIGGRELARRLLSQHPGMRALFVSSDDDETIQHHQINRRYVLQQPYRQAGLVEKVRELLDAA